MYPFLDVNDLGYGGLAVSAAGFAIAFWVLGLLFVLIDRIPAGLTARATLSIIDTSKIDKEPDRAEPTAPPARDPDAADLDAHG